MSHGIKKNCVNPETLERQSTTKQSKTVFNILTDYLSGTLSVSIKLVLSIVRFTFCYIKYDLHDPLKRVVRLKTSQVSLKPMNWAQNALITSNCLVQVD